MFDFWVFVHSVALLKLYSQKQSLQLPGTAALDFFAIYGVDQLLVVSLMKISYL